MIEEIREENKSLFKEVSFFHAFNDSIVESDRKQGRERGNDTQQRPTGSGLEPGPTVVRTIASVHGASAYPTAPPTAPKR